MTRRLAIRSFVMADAPELQAILGDEEAMACLEPPYDLAETEAFLREFCIGRQGALAAVLRTSGQVIGYLLFHEVEPGAYEIGWVFHRAHWRQGYAYEASRALMQYAFETLGARRVTAETVDPIRAAGLLKKLGMRLEGVEPMSADGHEGRWKETYLYGISRPEA